MRNIFRWIFYILSLLLLGGFGYALYYDYTVAYPWGSSPFWLYILVRGVELFIPGVCCLILGLLMGKKK